VSLDDWLHECLANLESLDEVILPLKARERELRRMLIATFPTRLHTHETRRFPEMAVTQWTRDGIQDRNLLHPAHDEANRGLAPPVKERKQWQLELDHVNYLMKTEADRLKAAATRPGDPQGPQGDDLFDA
jgi:hypothetical protein